MSHYYLSTSLVSHCSFVSMLPSLLAENGYDDTTIAVTGRWSSAAWTHYVKRSRSTKLATRVKLAKEINAMVS